jgi:VWFA-related protein
MRFAFLFLIFLFCLTTHAQEQTVTRDFAATKEPRVEIINLYGQVRLAADENLDKITVLAASPGGAVADSDLTIQNEKGAITIEVKETSKRVDLIVRVPVRARVKITGKDSQIEVGGNLEQAEVFTETGTIYADVPTDDLRFNFLWTQRRPRFLSDIALPEPEEKAGGKFALAGKFPDEKTQKSKVESQKPEAEEISADAKESTGDDSISEDQKPKTKNRKKKKPEDKRVSLNFTTERGVILLNVPPNEVPSDLRERDLTEAAKTIIRSGDSILINAIRKVSPRKFGDFAKTLPPFRSEPTLGSRERQADASAAAATNTDELRRVNVNVTDKAGRAVNNLTKADFAVFEGGAEREILDLQTATTPFNLVLLLDVSGSVEERIDFVRKAARQFINTVSAQDRLAIVTFRDDVQVLSNFSGNKRQLSDALDSFDAGGATAVYDALAFSLVETLKPLRGERTAVVILSDGDDNRSFIPFEPLLGTIEESGALVYPLYLPSGLIPADRVPDSAQAADPLRTRYLQLTTKADAEGKRLAEVSGGVYFPIRRFEDLQKAYDDVVAQLRTAYTVTYRSKTGVQPRLRVQVKREGVFARPGSVTTVAPQLQSRFEGDDRNYFQPAAFQRISFFPQTADTADITGEVKKISYKPFAAATLREFSLEGLDVNRAPPSFVATGGASKIAVSRWVSPKRSRSYPYERLYNTLAHPKRAAVVPVFKDEGQSGDRDFLAWDTVSLLNLLEVYVVLGYYDSAAKSPRRADSLVEQKFNNDFVSAKLKELSWTNLSAFEWNLRELKNLKQTVELAKAAYQKIAETTDVSLHEARGVENFERKLTGDIRQFLEFSRAKSQKAQRREVSTEQPKESLQTPTKSRITISDYLGGKYFFTVDETLLINDQLFLIESKHNQGGKFTAIGDIKDALVKMILYANLVDVKRAGKLLKARPVMRLTASQMQGAISSQSKPEEIAKFIERNRFDLKQTNLLQTLINEAKQNNFLLKVEQANTRIAAEK